MKEAIGAVLPFAVGIGISPIPIVASILILFSPRSRTNGPAFLLGWVIALAVVVTAVTLIAGGAGASDGGSGADAISWGKVVLGVVLLAAGLRRWRGRPGPDEEPETPGWMATIDELTAVKAVGLGAVLGGVNPKNLALAVGAGSALATLDPTGSDLVAGIVVFVAIASSFIAATVGYDLLGGEGAEHHLQDAKAWLLANNAAVMAVLFLVFGAVLVSHGLQGR